MFLPRLPGISGTAICLALGLLLATAAPSHAQSGAPTKAAPQATSPAPQTIYSAPQAYPSGQYASPQAAQPCACYFPQGRCPFPTGYCAFPRGNCIAVQPSGQWPAGSPQFGSPQAPRMIGD